MVELRAEVEPLRRENLEFRQQVGYWQSRHRDALLRIAALEQEVEQLEGQKRQLQADLFGRRSETKPLKDRSNHLDDPQDDSHHPKRKRGQQPENHGPQRRDDSRLPVREQFVDLPPEQCVCPDCGQPFRLRSDTEDSEQIEIDKELVVGDLPEQVVADSLFAEGGEGIEVCAVQFRSRAVGEEPRNEVRKVDEGIEQVNDKLLENTKVQERLTKQTAFLDQLDGFVAASAKSD